MRFLRSIFRKEESYEYCRSEKALLHRVSLVHAKNNENHAYLDPKALRAAGGPRYAFYFLVTRILPAYYLFRLILILVFMKVETVYE